MSCNKIIFIETNMALKLQHPENNKFYNLLGKRFQESKAGGHLEKPTKYIHFGEFEYIKNRR